MTAEDECRTKRSRTDEKDLRKGGVRGGAELLIKGTSRGAHAIDAVANEAEAMVAEGEDLRYKTMELG